MTQARPEPHGVLAVIPARYAALRFPGKALTTIAGKPMIQHVLERVSRVEEVTRVVVATDDERIAKVVQGLGGEAVQTGDHATGTDRVAEAVRLLAGENAPPFEWVLNVQGDEPLIDPRDLQRLIAGTRAEPGAVLGTLVHPLRSEAELNDPHVVKAVLDHAQRALYFSRAPVPYPREPGLLGWRHQGVYLFRRDFLATFAELPPSPLSQREQLEQLRALESGYPIHCVASFTLSLGVDVPADVQRVEAELARHG